MRQLFLPLGAVDAKAERKRWPRLCVFVVAEHAAAIDGEDNGEPTWPALHEFLYHVGDVGAVGFSWRCLPKQLKHGLFLEKGVIARAPEPGQLP